MARRFEFVEGGTSKFWEITEAGLTFTVRYGRIGAAGQTQEKSFATEGLARAAAAKVIAEKTGKGYVEVAAADAAAPDHTVASEPAPEATSAVATAGAVAPDAPPPAAAGSRRSTSTGGPPKAPKSAAAKPEKREVPAFTFYNGKSLGARALANAAERFAAATDSRSWYEASTRISHSEFEVDRVLLHMLTHGVFAPTNRLNAVRCAAPLLAAEPDVALSVMAGLDEALLAPSRSSAPPILAFLPVLARVQRDAPADLRAATLPPTLAAGALLVRALAGDDVTSDEGAAVVALIGALVPYSASNIKVLDADDRPASVSSEALGAALLRAGGPRWIRTIPNPGHVPAEVAIPALADEPLEEVGRVLSLFNKEILDVRTEAPARFFEVAATLHEQPAGFMRAAGVRLATHPDQIPAGGEDLLHPRDVFDDPGFGKLGMARLDAWAERWLRQFPGAITATEPEDEAYSVGVGLLGLALLGVPFSEAMARTLLGQPRPYTHAPELIDVRGWFERTSSFTSDGALVWIPRLVQLASEHDGDVARCLRITLAAAVRRVVGDIPDVVDDVLSLGDPVDYDTGRAVTEAIQSLPAARAERVIARTAHLLKDPYEELDFACADASDAAVRRYARLVARGRDSGDMWDHARKLGDLGPRFGPALATALAGETLSDSFFERLERSVDADVLAHVRDAVGTNVLDLVQEMRALADGGPTTRVYVLSPGEGAVGLARIGGKPPGFSTEDVPRHRGRKLAHAFTVDLARVPELAARYPGARTLTVWVQAYSEDTPRAQALIPRTDAELSAIPGEGGEALDLLALDVPTAIFDEAPNERAAYARRLLYQRPGFLLGGPLWLQMGPSGLDPAFVGQYDERIAPSVNLGDAGICYSFTDRAEWQCH